MGRYAVSLARSLGLSQYKKYAVLLVGYGSPWSNTSLIFFIHDGWFSDKDKMVSWLFYLNDRNPYTRKDSFYIETVLRSTWSLMIDMFYQIYATLLNSLNAEHFIGPTFKKK